MCESSCRQLGVDMQGQYADNAEMVLCVAGSQKCVSLMFDTQCQSWVPRYSPCLLWRCWFSMITRVTPTPSSSPTTQELQRCVNAIKLSGLLNSKGFLHQPMFHHSHSMMQNSLWRALSCSSSELEQIQPKVATSPTQWYSNLICMSTRSPSTKVALLLSVISVFGHTLHFLFLCIG